VPHLQGLDSAIPQRLELLEEFNNLALQLKLFAVASGWDGIAAQFDIAPDPCPIKLRLLIGDGQCFDAAELQPAHQIQ